MTGVVTLGETMALFRATEVGPLEQVADFRLAIGGAESNVAIALARLGTESTWIGAVGDDGFGRRILRELRAEGVAVVATVDADAPTGLMVKSQRTTESTAVAYYRAASAGSRIAVTDAAASAISAASLLHVTGITPALSATSATAVETAIDLAVAAGVPVSFDINHRESLWRGRDAASVYRAIAARSTIVFAGEDEAALLADGDHRELASAIAELGPTQVIIKRGAAGCSALIDGERFEMPAVAVSIADTVGAGDAFVAGYLAELLAGLTPEARLRTAVTVGAFACTNPGDWEGYPRRSELATLGAAEPVTR